MSGDAPLLHRMLAVLLRYPDEGVLDRLDDVTAALPALRRRADRDRVGALAARLRDLPATRSAQDYVAVFDHDRHRTLHLTYYRHGDTRGRGMALLALKDAYRRAGHPPPEHELPDYLPLMLEFAALSPVNGRRLLAAGRPSLEMLRQALHAPGGAAAPHTAAAPYYAAVLDALCERLPALRTRQRRLLRRLAEGGPPREDVGLEPFAPPAYLTGTAVPGERR